MNALSFGALCFSSLFTVIDPFAVAPVFTSITNGKSREQTRRIALRACLVAFGVLFLFAVSGAFLFKLFGITLHAFRIGGGIVFVLLALPMLTGSGHKTDDVDAEASEDPSVVPLGMPLIGGPGSITTIMLLMGQSTTTFHTTALLVALLVAIVATFGVLLVAPRVIRRLGSSGTQLVTKVMGLIILVIGVQFIVDGVKPIAVEILQTARA